MNFEWDKRKTEVNARKHGVSFEEAATVFGDPLSITLEDPDHSENELRFLLLGQSYSGRVLVISHTDRDETLRIISARLASRHEQRAYREDFGI